MSESVIADFVGTFNAETLGRGEPVTGRVLLSQKRLVLAADNDSRLQIPLSSIFDVAVGHVPDDLGDFFDSTVTIAFERNDRRFAAAVEADDGTIGKFSTVLFKALLNGTEVTIKHPARRGGRVTDEAFEAATLSISSEAVEFGNDRRTISIDLAQVSGFDRGSREIGGKRRPVLLVRHMAGEQSLTTVAAMQSARRMSILGRYLRLEYSDLVADLADLDLSTDETEVLVAIYSGAGSGGVSLADVLDVEGAQVSMLLDDLADRELVVDADDGTKLTPKGRVVVTNHLERIDA